MNKYAAEYIKDDGETAGLTIEAGTLQEAESQADELGIILIDRLANARGYFQLSAIKVIHLLK